jgi:hypothetical protein
MLRTRQPYQPNHRRAPPPRGFTETLGSPNFTVWRLTCGAGSRLTSGQALPSIASLAEHYGVSRATVAKALRRVAGDGLVEVVPQWGTFRT